MSTQLSKLDGLKNKMIVAVSADDFKKAYDNHFNTMSKKANIKGFRPGKVPVNILEQKFGRSLLQEAAGELVQSSFDAAVKSNHLKLASMPSIECKFEELKKNQGFEYTAIFEVYPEVTLKDLTGLEIEKIESEITEEDIESMLIKMRTQHAEWESVERAAKLGDRLSIDFDGIMDGKPLERGSAKNTHLELGSNSMISGFEDGLIGIKKDEKRVLTLSFPKEYHVENLRGKPVEFTVLVHAIEEPKLPILNDDFAKKMGVETGIDDLKKRIKSRMESEIAMAAHQALKTTVFDKLMELNTIEAPNALIDAEIHSLQHTMRQRMHSINPNMTESQLNAMPMSRELFLDEAKKRVILGLLLAEVIKNNDIKPNQEQVNRKIAEIAVNYPNSAEIISMYNKNDRLRSEIEAYVLEEQAVEALLAKAILKNVKKNYDALMQSK